MTELDPWADERTPEPPPDDPPWRLALLVGVAIIPLAALLPRAFAPLWLLAPAAVGGLTGGSAFFAGAAVGIPSALVLVVVTIASLGWIGLVAPVPAAMYVAFSGLVGSAGRFAVRTWFERGSNDPEIRERARRGMIIVAVGLLLVGVPTGLNAVFDQRADDRAEALERRLVAVTRASVPFDGFALTNDLANPITSAVPEVHIIATGVGANMQAEARWGWSTRCVMVQVKDTEVTSRITGSECGPLVGG